MSTFIDPDMTKEVNLLSEEVLEFLISSNMDSMNDILLNLLIKNIKSRNKFIDNDVNLDVLINSKSSDPDNEAVANILNRYDLVDNYYKYILTEECILDRDQNLKAKKVKTSTLKSACLSQLEERLELLGFELQIVQTTNSEEYSLVYSNIVNHFPMLTDSEITEKIESWGNLNKSYHFVKTKEPGMQLSLKLTTQSEFNKNEIFFIKSIAEILGKSKESLLYSLKDINLTKVDKLNKNYDIFLIGLYKLYYNMELIEKQDSYESFVDSLKSEQLNLGLLKRHDYMIDEIQSAYNMSYDYYKENEAPTSDPNDKTYVEEIQRLNQNEIKRLLDYLIQQKWVILYPNSSLKASLKLHYEMNTYSAKKCFKCPNDIAVYQGIQCASCNEGMICLSCSKAYFSVSKHTLNKKDKSLTDGKWCPKCFEPWRSPSDMLFYL